MLSTPARHGGAAAGAAEQGEGHGSAGNRPERRSCRQRRRLVVIRSAPPTVAQDWSESHLPRLAEIDPGLATIGQAAQLPPVEPGCSLESIQRL